MIHFHLYKVNLADTVIKIGFGVSCGLSLDDLLAISLSEGRAILKASCTKPIALVKLEIYGTPVIAVACSSQIFKGT